MAKRSWIWSSRPAPATRLDRRAEADPEVIRSEVADGVLECQERVVGTDPAMGRAARLVQPAEDGTKPLVRLLGGLVGGRGDPVQSPRQPWCDDHELVGCVDQRPSAVGKLLCGPSGLAGGDQSPSIPCVDRTDSRSLTEVTIPAGGHLQAACCSASGLTSSRPCPTSPGRAPPRSRPSRSRGAGREATVAPSSRASSSLAGTTSTATIVPAPATDAAACGLAHGGDHAGLRGHPARRHHRHRRAPAPAADVLVAAAPWWLSSASCAAISAPASRPATCRGSSRCTRPAACRSSAC